MKIFIYFFIIFIFTGCSLKNYEHSEAKVIIIKSPKIKFADVGYIRHTDKNIGLELFSAGHLIQKIEINHLICLNNGCMTKSGFNEDYLYYEYPSDIMQNIILGQPIYNSKRLEKTKNGFSQIIRDGGVRIKYIVTNSSIYFKDKKNKILIKIKDFNK